MFCTKSWNTANIVLQQLNWVYITFFIILVSLEKQKTQALFMMYKQKDEENKIALFIHSELVTEGGRTMTKL